MIVLCAVGMLCLFIPSIMRRRREEKIRLLWASQLRQSLRNIVYALRMGVGFQQALDHAAGEGSLPLSGEWRRLLQSRNLGTPWREALSELSQRVQIPEIASFVSAVLITQSTGAALADVLETLAETLQERQALRQKIHALTAQGKASGMVLAVLPFLLLTALALIVPDLMRPMFTTSLGQCLLAGALVSIALGGMVIWKIVHVRI